VIEQPRKVKHVAPKYPADARRAGLAGAVILECTVDAQGRVSDAKILRGVHPLAEAAVKAVKQWRYSPTLLGGVPVPVIMTVTVNFKVERLEFRSLLGSLGHRNEHIREAAARNLGALRARGHSDQEALWKAIGALEPLAERDKSPRVRGAALRSLSRLDGRPLPPAPEPEPPPTADRPGRAAAESEFVDPLGQCEITKDGDRVEIGVPPGAFDLSIELGLTTAPRLMQPIEGDLVARVKVDELPEPGPPAAGVPRRGFHGAGLLLWQDERSYVRLESAVYVADDLAVRYALFEVRREGKPVRGLAPADVRLHGGPTELRLERRGRDLLAQARQGDEEWREVGRAQVDLPERLEVGIAAVNAAETGLRAGFRGFGLSSEAGAALPIEHLPEEAEAPADGTLVMRPSDVDWPRPLRTTKPQYPREAFDEKIEGTVVVEILIDTGGRVVKSRVIQSVPGLDQAALECVQSWTFRPAMKDGKAVPTIAHAPVIFRIY
jgi:TonB family protein